MQFALKGILNAFKLALPNLPDTQLHFIGTDYAAGKHAREWVMPIARNLGIEQKVSETPHRVGYFEALCCLLDADALIVPGSDDATYTASKIYPYIAAQKPLLTVFHQQSSVNDVMATTKAGTAVSFTEDQSVAQVADEIWNKWYVPKQYLIPPSTNWEKLEPFTAKSMTAKLVNIFEQVVAEANPSRKGE
jgi:hypothetical protein